MVRHDDDFQAAYRAQKTANAQAFAVSCLFKSIFVTLKHQRAVGAAEAERAGCRHADIGFARCVGAVIQIAARFKVLVYKVDGGRGDLVANRQHAVNGFHAACCAEQMPRHGFGWHRPMAWTCRAR